MIRQVTILFLAVSAVLSAPTDVVPLEKQQPTVIPIISQSEELEPNGTYKFSYETGNGIKREEIQFDKIVPKLRGQSDASNEGGENDDSDEIHVQQGSYSYTAPDGTVITLRYIADENGFQAFGDHLPRAPVPVSVTSSLSDKSGRALKSVDNAEVAPVPVSATKPEPEPAKPTPEAAQSVPEALPQASEAASALPESSAAEISNEVEPKPVEVSEQSAPVEDAEQSSTTVASEALTEVASTTVVADQSSTAESDQSEANAEQPSTTAAAESSTAAADQSTPVLQTVIVEEPASTTQSEVAVTNTPVEQESSTRTDDVLTSNAADYQTSSSATAEESSVSESEQSGTTAAALLPEEPASTTASV